MLFLLSQILVLRDTMAFYSRDITNALRREFQGYVHVMEWEKVPRGTKPEEFWKRFWKKAGSRYDFVVVLGPKSLSFTMENVKDRPVFYVRNYHRLRKAPPNFASVYVAISYPIQIARLTCAFEDARVLGILLHRDEWSSLSGAFDGEYPGVTEVHIRVVENPLQMEQAISDLRDVGVKVAWIPSDSRLNTGKYIQNLLKASKKKKVGVFVDRVSMVRQGAIGAWEPRPKDVGEALVNLFAEIKEIATPYIEVKQDTVDSVVVKVKKVNWKAFLRPHYLRFIKSNTRGKSAINLSLAKKFRLRVNGACADRFDEKY